MEQQQAAFLEMMQGELQSDEEENVQRTEGTKEMEKSDNPLKCAMCREKGSRSEPLGQVGGGGKRRYCLCLPLK